jgi:hypothetical protein
MKTWLYRFLIAAGQELLQSVSFGLYRRPRMPSPHPPVAGQLEQWADTPIVITRADAIGLALLWWLLN